CPGDRRDTGKMQTSTARVPRDDRPFLPTDIDLSRSLIRAATAIALAHIRNGVHYPEHIAAESWPRDQAARAIINRAASAAISTTTTGISAVQQTIAGAFVSGLQHDSAAAALIEAGIRVDLTGTATVSIPRADPASQPAPVFVGEGAPIPVAQGLTAS